MQDINNITQDNKTGERTAAGHPARRSRVLDYTVLAFIIATLVLMPLLAGGTDATSIQSDTGSLPVEAREALAESRGDATASAALENATLENAGEHSGGARTITAADGNPVDGKTRDAIDAASRGDASAQGSVASNYNEAGGEH